MVNDQPHSHAAEDEERDKGEQKPLKVFCSLDPRVNIVYTLGISILSVVRTIVAGQMSQHSLGIRGRGDSGLSTSAT